MEFRGIKPIEDVAPLAALATQIDMHVERCGTQCVVTGMAAYCKEQAKVMAAFDRLPF